MSAQQDVRIAPVPWQRLREWVETHAAQEEEQGSQRQLKADNGEGNDEGTLLTPVQLQAISQLVPFLDQPELELDGSNYVSKLLESFQTKGNDAKAVFTDEPTLSVPIKGVMQSRFRCSCKLIFFGTEKQVPCEGYGAAPGQEAPYFQAKKALKYMTDQKKKKMQTPVPFVPAQETQG